VDWFHVQCDLSTVGVEETDSGECEGFAVLAECVMVRAP
jgi:hypothetical protein